MIILDTNILTKSGIDSATTDLVKIIRTSGIERVAVPWVVLEELTAHRAVPYRRKYEAAEAALRSLTEGTPWPIRVPLPQMNLQRFQDEWREKWLAVVDVIPTSEAALKQALMREANLLPPCKQVTINEGGERAKIGGRDAAIWLTAVEYAREHPDETVYFVSKNTTDFGDGVTFPYPMNEDLADIKDRFVLLTTWYDVVEKFAQRTDDADEAVVRSILQAPESLSAIEAEATRLMLVPPDLEGPGFEGTMGIFVESEGTLIDTDTVRVLGWAVPPFVAFDQATDLTAYRIGDHVWCTATVRWVLSGPALLRDTLRIKGVGCFWETRVLVSTTNVDARLTVLRGQGTRALPAGQVSVLSPELADYTNLISHERTWMEVQRLQLSGRLTVERLRAEGRLDVTLPPLR
ncbi:PIN domain-containing protein [Streptomyces canus]|uniref:PIN domain-containing protein n=1 Tax=Streptomyces canus TaxID=58343 RepID=UPI002E2F7CD9|nr:PIN domain-containing protein [Streptomyces canus]